MINRHIRASVICLALFEATGLVGAPSRDRSPVVNPQDGSLFWRLPIEEDASPFILGVRITSANQTLVREVIEIPSGAPHEAVIQLLAGHPAELQQIRDREQAAPGSIQVRISKGQSVLEDAPFARIEAMNARFSNAVSRMTGRTRFVDINLRNAQGRIRALDMQPDPACVQHCADDRYYCYTERCDPRGSCQYCEDYYNDCVISCPQICVEPKSVSYYTADRSYASTDGSLSCYAGYGVGDLYQFWQVVTYHDHYKRTTHCDDTYTDELQNTTSDSYVCWRLYSPNSCFGSQPVPSVCPF